MAHPWGGTGGASGHWPAQSSSPCVIPKDVNMRWGSWGRWTPFGLMTSFTRTFAILWAPLGLTAVSHTSHGCLTFI